MRIIHLLSNRKWTERAEPVVNLARVQQDAGHQVLLVCGRWHRPSGADQSVAAQARARGVTVEELELEKHFRLPSALRDLPRLRAIIDGHNTDLIHAHMENAHLLAAWARARTARQPPIVYSSYEPDGPPPGLRARWLQRRCSEGLVVISETARAQATHRFRVDPSSVKVIEPGIDLDFFDPGRPLGASDERFGFGHDDFVAGIVSRLRPDRRVDLALSALAALRPTCPHLRLVIVGRGESHASLQNDVRTAGLATQIRFPGYLTGDDLVAAYRAMSVLVYPAPGTDQSCRTIREAMASGLPVVGVRTGFVTELIEQGKTGLLFEPGSVDGLSEALQRLYNDRTLLQQLASSSLDRARERFALDLQARRTLAFYEQLLQARGRAP